MATYRCSKTSGVKVTVKLKTLEELRRLLRSGDVGSAKILLDCVLDQDEQEYYAGLAKELHARSQARAFRTSQDYFNAWDALDKLIL